MIVECSSRPSALSWTRRVPDTIFRRSSFDSGILFVEWDSALRTVSALAVSIYHNN